MIEELKTLLGDTAANYTDAQITLAFKIACAEVEEYCKRDLDTTLELMAMQIAKIKLNRLNTEGLAQQGFSGVNESYINDYPADIQKVLTRKRKVKIV